MAPVEVLQGAAAKEMAWLRAYDRPRLPYDRVYRDITNYQKSDPQEHLQNLESYKQIVPSLYQRKSDSIDLSCAIQISIQTTSSFPKASKLWASSTGSTVMSSLYSCMLVFPRTSKTMAIRILKICVNLNFQLILTRWTSMIERKSRSYIVDGISTSTTLEPRLRRMSLIFMS